MKTLQTYKYGPASENPQSLVILLHGLGANGQDLLGLAPLYAQLLPDTVFIAPDAPFPCDMAPFGYQWFSLQDRRPPAMLDGVRMAEPILNDYITEQMNQHNVTPEKTALVGFSQGTMMSLYAGLRYPARLAGILGYSGALITDETPLSAAPQKPPICLIHGDSDGVVPVVAYHHARAALDEAGFDLTGGVTAGLQHNIDEAGIRDGAFFLKRVLG